MEFNVEAFSRHVILGGSIRPERMTKVTREGFVDVDGGRVWYTMQGEGRGIPLVVLHGGPGSSCISLEPLLALSSERPIVLYDQLGCGNSDRPTDASLWHIERFVRELEQLRDALELTDVHLLGHSWGTMLLADYLLTKPTGVKSAIFSSPCLSAKMWMEDAMMYREQLPLDIQMILNQCEQDGTTDSEEYERAAEVYISKHVRRIDLPEDTKERRKKAFGKDVYNIMWGPSEFCATGNLKEYDRTGRLSEISVPSLFTCGSYDEASPRSTAYYQSLVAGAKLHVFDNCAHVPQLEDTDAYLRVIGEFLHRIEQR